MRCLWNRMANAASDYYAPKVAQWISIDMLFVLYFHTCSCFRLIVAVFFLLFFLLVHWTTQIEEQCRKNFYSRPFICILWLICIAKMLSSAALGRFPIAYFPNDIKPKLFGARVIYKSRKRSYNFYKIPYWTDICWSIKLFMLLLFKNSHTAFCSILFADWSFFYVDHSGWIDMINELNKGIKSIKMRECVCKKWDYQLIREEKKSFCESRPKSTSQTVRLGTRQERERKRECSQNQSAINTCQK